MADDQQAFSPRTKSDPTPATAARLDTCDHKECLSSDRCLYGDNAGPTQPETAAPHSHGSIVEQVHRVMTTDQGVDAWVIAEEAVKFVRERTLAAGRWEYGLRRDDGVVETTFGGTGIRDEADARTVIAAEGKRSDGLPPVSFTVVRRWVGKWEAVDG